MYSVVEPSEVKRWVLPAVAVDEGEPTADLAESETDVVADGQEPTPVSMEEPPLKRELPEVGKQASDSEAEVLPVSEQSAVSAIDRPIPACSIVKLLSGSSPAVRDNKTALGVSPRLQNV